MENLFHQNRLVDHRYPPFYPSQPSPFPVPSALPPSAPSPSVSSISDGLDMDPELAKYLNRSYWENKSAGTTNVVKPAAANDAETVVSRHLLLSLLLFTWWNQ